MEELKPFDKCLVRNNHAGLWIPALYGMKKGDRYVTSAGWQTECVPYEGNEELLGTSYIPRSAYCKVCEKQGCTGLDKCEYIDNFRKKYG